MLKTKQDLISGRICRKDIWKKEASFVGIQVKRELFYANSDCTITLKIVSQINKLENKYQLIKIHKIQKKNKLVTLSNKFEIIVWLKGIIEKYSASLINSYKHSSYDLLVIII